ncbi:MAG: sterol desaturase family protein [Alphaproteobacteria bacterium]
MTAPEAPEHEVPKLENAFLAHEPTIRLAAFLGLLALIAVWEALRPRRALAAPKTPRWLSNFGLVALDSLVLRFAFPLLAIDLALTAEERGFGLFNLVPAPRWLAIVATVLVLDLVIYLQHRAFHAVPLLWRLHMVHHTDRGFDVSTGVRFHPVEITLSMGIKMAIVALLGAPASGVLVFEVFLSATSLFNHGNVFLLPAVDRYLRLIVVTPDMHRVHHSIDPVETNSNYGFNLPWWDRLFGSYRAQPAAGHERMTIGLEQFPEARRLLLHHLLILPFSGRTGRYPAGRYRKRAASRPG